MSSFGWFLYSPLVVESGLVTLQVGWIVANDVEHGRLFDDQAIAYPTT